jgi:hypothetical protein
LNNGKINASEKSENITGINILLHHHNMKGMYITIKTTKKAVNIEVPGCEKYDD